MIDTQTGTIIGEVCHIHAQSPGGPRYSPEIVGWDLDGPTNLILLCAAHHKVVDDHPGQFSIEILEAMKSDHESRARPLDRERLLNALTAIAPPVPSDWWRRPGAPTFRLSLAASRPPNQPHTFEATIIQKRGGDVGDFRARFAGEQAETELSAPRYTGNRETSKWRLPPLQLGGRSRERFERDSAAGIQAGEFAIEIRFWWAGAERVVLMVWRTTNDFQNVEPEVRYF